MTEENLIPQNLNQKKTLLARSEHAPLIIELMKDCMTKNNKLIAKTQWDTVVNAITLDVQGNMIQAMVNYLDHIQKGGLMEQQ